MNRVGIVLIDWPAPIQHFITLANTAQAQLKFEKLELTAEEEIQIQSPPEDFHDSTIAKTMEQIADFKRKRGFHDEDLFILFTEKKINDSTGKDPYFSIGNSLSETPPGVALISLDYLLPKTSILKYPDDRNYAGKSIQLNLLTVLVWAFTQMEMHYTTNGCIMDFCGSIPDINHALENDFVFCTQEGCQKLIQQTEVGKAIQKITDKLNEHPYRDLSSYSMMPICFKTGRMNCSLNPRVKPNQVFVGMPFGNDYVDAFEFGIKPSLEARGFPIWRAKEHRSLKDLMCKVCEAIQNSEFAIIDLTGLNPNVMFELGICIALGRKVLLLKHEKTDIVTDLKGMEYLSYQHTTDLKQKLPEAISDLFR